MKDPVNKYAVSLLFIRQNGNSTENDLRADVIERRSQEEALGAFILSLMNEVKLKNFHISLYTVIKVKDSEENSKPK